MMRPSNLLLSIKLALRSKKSKNFIVLTESETAKVIKRKIVKEPSLSLPVTSIDQFLSITFQKDKLLLETKSEQRTSWIILPPQIRLDRTNFFMFSTNLA